MADLPEISQNLDDPLPQVDPNSQLVPYRMSRTDPGGQPVVTTGYGPRGRPPIQPPESFGGGVGMPDLDQIYQAAFSKLPVDEAAKAVEAATRYVGQRAYQRELQSGGDPIKTFAKYAPIMFRQATGIPEAFQLTAPPSPQQMIQNQQRAATEQRLRDEMNFRQTHVSPDTQARIDAQRELAKNKPKQLEPQEHAELTDAYKQFDEARKDMAKFTLLPATSKTQAKLKQEAMDDATFRMNDARKTIAKFNPTTPPPMTPGQPAAQPQVKVLPFPKSKAEAVKDVVYATKNGPMRWNGEKFVPVQ